MTEKIRKRLCKLKKRLHKIWGKEALGQIIVLKRPDKPEIIEERREKALGYLVEKYFESKRHEEEIRRKLESYGRVRRWVYKRSVQLKDAGMIVREVLVKPAVITLMAFSVFFSILLGMTIAPQIVKFTAVYIPNPFKYVVDVLILFPIGFSPGILGIVLNYYVEKEKLKRTLKNYGIEI